MDGGRLRGWRRLEQRDDSERDGRDADRPQDARHRGLLGRGRRTRRRLQREVLDAPVLRFPGVQLVLADAVHLVYPVELPDLFADRPEPAEQVPFEIFLVDLAAGIRAEEELLPLRVWRCDAHGP